ncbi:hypothetical protein FRC03_008615 [Tulasnella sp. 419]|nr:hypothetical protein FRC03_008615 [Tulasnella sp. 419]
MDTTLPPSIPRATSGSTPTSLRDQPTSTLDSLELGPTSQASLLRSVDNSMPDIPPLEQGSEHLPDPTSRHAQQPWYHPNTLAQRYPRTWNVLFRIGSYLRGPIPPETLHRPNSIFNRKWTIGSQSITLNLETRWLKLTRRLGWWPLLVLFAVAYIISVSFLVRASWFLTPQEAFVGCTSSFWLPKDQCGLDGQDCAPFVAEQPMEFRCPASCKSVILANIRAVGSEEVVYQPLVVGGGDAEATYRGDSWICASAIHAGVISNSRGGCGKLSLIGNFTSFVGTVSNGIRSTSFPSIFPLTYRFLPTTSLNHCTDLRDYGLVVNILVTVLLFSVFQPASIVLYWCLVCIGHWHVTLFSDPRGEPPPISDAFGVFLPTLFVAYVFWRVAFRHVLPVFEHCPLERMVWYLVGFWPGVLFNITTEKIPIDRLLGEDLRRPGAITALVILSIVVLVVVLNQLQTMRKTGWLPVYAWYYFLGFLVLVVLSQLPGLTLRIHHFFIGMILMPGTAFPTRISAVAQSFLLGMFIQGESRWGFDSILQTTAELRRDAPLDSSIPGFLTSSTYPPHMSNSTIIWKSIETAGVVSEGWNGYSLIIDDVERYSGTALNFALTALDLAIPHFFRLAYQRDGVSGDYSKAATLFPNGTFLDPLPGPS